MLSRLNFVVAYLMNSENIERHKKHVHEIFRRIKDNGLKLKDKKCDFFMKRIKYLDQIIHKDGKKPDPEQANPIKKTIIMLLC